MCFGGFIWCKSVSEVVSSKQIVFLINFVIELSKVFGTDIYAIPIKAARLFGHTYTKKTIPILLLRNGLSN
jgi:hypothetical protein